MFCSVFYSEMVIHSFFMGLVHVELSTLHISRPLAHARIHSIVFFLIYWIDQSFVQCCVFLLLSRQLFNQNQCRNEAEWHHKLIADIEESSERYAWVHGVQPQIESKSTPLEWNVILELKSFGKMTDDWCSLSLFLSENWLNDCTLRSQSCSVCDNTAHKLLLFIPNRAINKQIYTEETFLAAKEYKQLFLCVICV